jgi:hypothetical protein
VPEILGQDATHVAEAGRVERALEDVEEAVERKQRRRATLIAGRSRVDVDGAPRRVARCGSRRPASTFRRRRRTCAFGELLIPGLAIAERPDVNEPGIDRTGRAHAAVPASGHHPSVIHREDLVGIGRESFHVRDDGLEHVLGDRLHAPVDATVRHPFALVPFDVGLHRREDRIDVAAPEGVIDALHHRHVCLTHSPSDPRSPRAPSSLARVAAVNTPQPLIAPHLDEGTTPRRRGQRPADCRNGRSAAARRGPDHPQPRCRFEADPIAHSKVRWQSRKAAVAARLFPSHGMGHSRGGCSLSTDAGARREPARRRRRRHAGARGRAHDGAAAPRQTVRRVLGHPQEVTRVAAAAAAVVAEHTRLERPPLRPPAGREGRNQAVRGGALAGAGGAGR